MAIKTNHTSSETTKTRRWFRFRLRTLLVMVTLLSVPLGWVGWELDQRRREKKVVAWVREMGGQVDWHSGKGNSPFARLLSDERSWWKITKDKWFGERVQLVCLFDKDMSNLSPLAELKNLEWLYLAHTEVSQLSPLADLKNLESLGLGDTQVRDLSPLAKLKNLDKLDLRNTQVTDLSPLSELKNLKVLWLRSTQVSEEQVQVLRQALPNCDIRY